VDDDDHLIRIVEFAVRKSGEYFPSFRTAALADCLVADTSGRMAYTIPRLEVRYIGAEARRAPGHRIDRPIGTGDWLFIHFRTPITMCGPSGERPLAADACILYEPGSPQRYHGDDQGYVIDYCHFAGADVAAWVKRCGIVPNRAIKPVSPQPFTALVRSLIQEFSRREKFWQEECALLLAQLLLAIGRAADTVRGTSITPRQAEVAQRIRDIRMRLHQDFGRTWTVAEMARAVHLSPSRFSHLYTELFGKPPLEDLIDVRIEQASWLLRTEHLTLKQVAPLCGFSNAQHLTRAFRRRVGCTPGAYARRKGGLDAAPAR
jgi:AraC-like DNA-binding protein